MTQNIQNGLEQLFELILPFSKEFSKNTYQEVFLSKYEEFKPLFAEIVQVCESAENREAVEEEIASVIPNKLKEALAEQSSKRKQESLLMNYNLGMVSFVIPMFRYGRMDACEPIVDRMVALWNDNGLGFEIAKSTYEEIQGGFKNHFCYITTAVCKSLGRPDNCYELNLMRDYRDGYLAAQDGGEEIIHEYYDVAPTIVKRIDRMENAGEVYRDIWNRYLQPCVKLIEKDEMEDCRKIYTDMVHDLQKKYLFS